MDERIVDRAILASASPRRLELLRSLNFAVEVVPSRYPEPDRPDLTPRELALEHALRKAEDVAGRRAPQRAEILLAADTVVDLDGGALNKPADRAQAEAMLRALSGRSHVVHTAFALHAPGCEPVLECVSAGVTFLPLDARTVARYVATGEPMDKAGGYGIQGYGATLVERVDGDFYTVMGLPLARFVQTLRRLGFAPPIQKRADRKPSQRA